MDLTPYDLRHAACTLHLRAEMNTLVLQKLMGHTGPQMTMRYTHLDIDDLRDQQRTSSPAPPGRGFSVDTGELSGISERLE